MIERLRKPGGTLGTLSLISAAVLAIVGVVGVVTMAVTLAVDSDFWSDKDRDQVTAMVVFTIAFAGAVGFLIEDHYPYVGAALAVVGGVLIAMMLFWTLVALVVGVGAAVVAVLRARALHGDTPAARPA